MIPASPPIPPASNDTSSMRKRLASNNGPAAIPEVWPLLAAIPPDIAVTLFPFIQFVFLLFEAAGPCPPIRDQIRGEPFSATSPVPGPSHGSRRDDGQPTPGGAARPWASAQAGLHAGHDRYAGGAPKCACLGGQPAPQYCDAGSAAARRCRRCGVSRRREGPLRPASVGTAAAPGPLLELRVR